jgi:hypothetical protein
MYASHKTHHHIKHSHMSHVDVITYKNLFHPQNPQYLWILINFNSYFYAFIIPLLGITGDFMYFIMLIVKERSLP